MERLLEKLAGQGGEHEGLAAIVTARFVVMYGSSEDLGLHINVLWHTACRAIDSSDRTAGGLVFGRLAELVRSSDSASKARAVELAGWIAAYEVWKQPKWTDSTYEWMLRHQGDATAQRVALHRLGAAALLAGHQSLATKIAFRLKPNCPDLRLYAEDSNRAAREQQANELFGLALGDDSQWALSEFCKFVEAL
jgi:hypothetical protein